MSKILSIIGYIFQDFKQNFFCVKLYVLIILQFFVLHIFLSPLKNFSLIVKHHITPWVFPFLLSDVYFTIFFMAGVIYYYSNVPFMQYTQMYQVIRTGRRKWALGKIGGIVISAYGLIFIETIISIIPLLPRMQFESGWGKIIYTLSMTDAMQKYGVDLYIPYEIISRYSPLKAIIIEFLISGLVISFIGIMMFAISIMFSRLAAICVVMIFEILPIIVLNLSGLHNNIIYFSPISWMNMTMIGVKSKCGFPQITYIITMLLIAISILSVLILWKIKRIDFQWNKEE